MFINWVWRTHYLALSHSYSSARPVKAASEITTGLPAQKTFGAWAIDKWDWQPRGKQNQVYLQADRCNSSQPDPHIFSWWIFGNKLNSGSGWAWRWSRAVLSPTCILLFPLSEVGTKQSAKKASENTLRPAMAGKDWQCQKSQPLGLPWSGLLVKKGNFESAHTILI